MQPVRLTGKCQEEELLVQNFGELFGLITSNSGAACLKLGDLDVVLLCTETWF